MWGRTHLKERTNLVTFSQGLNKPGGSMSGWRVHPSQPHFPHSYPHLSRNMSCNFTPLLQFCTKYSYSPPPALYQYPLMGELNTNWAIF
jgi:hypothetical protein